MALNAKVSICARKEAALTEAKLCGAVALGFSQLKESLPKYEIIIKNPTRFRTPLPILNFTDKKGMPFKNIPRRYVYTNTNEIF